MPGKLKKRSKKSTPDVAALAQEIAALRAWRAEVEPILDGMPHFVFARDERARLAKALAEAELVVGLISMKPALRSAAIVALRPSDRRAFRNINEPETIVALVEGLSESAVAIVREHVAGPEQRAWVDAVAHGVPARVRLRLADPGNGKNYTREIMIVGEEVELDDALALKAHEQVWQDGSGWRLTGFTLTGEAIRDMRADAFEARLKVDKELAAHVKSGAILVEEVPLADARRRWVSDEVHNKAPSPIVVKSVGLA